MANKHANKHGGGEVNDKEPCTKVVHRTCLQADDITCCSYC